MGDIVRKIEVCSLTAEGVQGKTCATVDALIDPGASSTVISSALAKRVGGKSLPKKLTATIEGRRFPLKLTTVKLHAPDCDIAPITAVVSDELLARAGLRVDALLGHDYLQRKRVALLYAEKTEDHKAACTQGVRRGRR